MDWIYLVPFLITICVKQPQYLSIFTLIGCEMLFKYGGLNKTRGFKVGLSWYGGKISEIVLFKFSYVSDKFSGIFKIFKEVYHYFWIGEKFEETWDQIKNF